LVASFPKRGGPNEKYGKQRGTTPLVEKGKSGEDLGERGPKVGFTHPAGGGRERLTILEDTGELLRGNLSIPTGNLSSLGKGRGSIPKGMNLSSYYLTKKPPVSAKRGGKGPRVEVPGRSSLGGGGGGGNDFTPPKEKKEK